MRHAAPLHSNRCLPPICACAPSPRLLMVVFPPSASHRPPPLPVALVHGYGCMPPCPLLSPVAIPPPCLEMARTDNKTVNVLDSRQQKYGGMETPAGSVTDIKGFSLVREQVLGLKLDKMSDRCENSNRDWRGWGWRVGGGDHLQPGSALHGLLHTGTLSGARVSRTLLAFTHTPIPLSLAPTPSRTIHHTHRPLSPSSTMHTLALWHTRTLTRTRSRAS
jgi:hypothetical protein